MQLCRQDTQTQKTMGSLQPDGKDTQKSSALFKSAFHFTVKQMKTQAASKNNSAAIDQSHIRTLLSAK